MHFHLGIECGATSSTALLQDSNGSNSKLFKFGAANYKLISQDELETKLRDLNEEICKEVVGEGQEIIVTKLGIAFPGLFDADKPVVENLVRKIWPKLETVWVGKDTDSAMACLQAWDKNDDRKQFDLHCIIIAGTGSCVFGTDGLNNAKIGGNGHILGDAASGYDIALQGLRQSVQQYERNNGKSSLFDNLKKSLYLPTTLELIRWSLLASKSDLASLAPVIFNEWECGDSLATKIVTEAIESLATDMISLIKKLGGKDSTNVKIGFTGSLLIENEKFRNGLASKITTFLQNEIPTMGVQFKTLQNTVQGALIKISNQNPTPSGGSNINKNAATGCCKELSDLNQSEESLYKAYLPILTALSPTECRNPNSIHLDSMSIEEAIQLWLNEESSFYDKIAQEKQLLKELIIQVTASFRKGGRLFYVGSGTSGRLGILDASECPPTFSTLPHMVQGITAGGKAAVFSSVEGAEDSISGGMRVIDEYGINSKDVVMGIACSGRTPFVWGALVRAKTLGAFTSFLTFNPYIKYQHKPDIILSFNIGPEILTGSTRLKSGSATKCVLNMITTLSMVQLGKCFENLMIDVNPCNVKLKERALRIVMAILNGTSTAAAVTVVNKGENKEEAELKFVQEDVHEVLKANNYNIKKTVSQLRRTLRQE